MNSKIYMQRNVHNSIICKSQDMGVTKVFISRQMYKEDAPLPHTHTLKYYSAIKKNEILPSAVLWM